MMRATAGERTARGAAAGLRMRRTLAALALLAPLIARAGDAAAASAPAAEAPAASASAAEAPAASASPVDAGASAPTRTLGGESAGGELLSRAELRECLRRRGALDARGAETQAGAAALEAEKARLLDDQTALGAARAGLDAQRRAAADLTARTRSYSERLAGWSARAQAVEGQAGRKADDERAALEQQRTGLQQEQQQIEADRSRLAAASADAVASFNARAGALDRRVSDWNRRQAASVADARSLAAEREAWAGACAQRRYREDDEAAIEKGEP